MTISDGSRVPPSGSAYSIATGASSGASIAGVGFGGVINDTVLGADAFTQSMWEPAPCAKNGHQLVDERTYADGRVGGRCEVCGDKIIGRRLPGGLGARRLQELVEGLMTGKRVLAEALADAVAQIKAEEEALDEARRLIVLAGAMLEQMPADAPEMTDPPFTSKEAWELNAYDYVNRSIFANSITVSKQNTFGTITAS